jgi:hypothetical protein
VVNIPSVEDMHDRGGPPYLVLDGRSQLAAFDPFGSTFKGTLEIDGYHSQPCAVRFFEDGRFNRFRREIEVYQATAEEWFTLQFYAAFSMFKFDEPWG